MQRWFVVVLAALCGCLAVPAGVQAEMQVQKAGGGELFLISTTTGTAGDEDWSLESATFDSTSSKFDIQVTDLGVDGIDTTSLPAGCTVNGNTLSCEDVASNRVIVYMGPGNDRFQVEDGSITEQGTVEVNGGAGGDLLSGGPGTDQVFGGSGSDQLTGGNGPDEIDGYNGAGSLATEADGPDVMGGGRGDDTLYDTGDSERDAADYSELFRTSGITVTMDGQSNDGHPSFDDTSALGSMLGGDNVGGGVEDVLGTVTEGDTITGDSMSNYLSGYGGDDTITGGGGHDELFGGGGGDTLNARDETSDPDVDCGDGTDKATVDAATVDTKVTGCETVDRGGGGGSSQDGTKKDGGTTAGGTGTGTGTATGTGGGTTTASGDITKLVPKKDVEVYPTRRVRFPSFLRGTKLCGRRKWCTVENVKRVLDRAPRMNYDLTEKKPTDKQLAALVGKPVGIGQVLDQTPDPGDEVETGPGKAVKVKLWTFTAKSLSKCDLKRPFIRVGSRVYKLTSYLKDLSPKAAEAALTDAGCKRSQYEIQDRFSRKVANPKVTGVKLVVDDGRRLRLTVSHGVPEIMFTFTKPRLVSGYIPVMWGDNNEIVIPEGEPTTLEVTPTKSGLGLSNLTVVLRDAGGEQVDYGRTRADGSAELNLQIAKSGRYELWTSLCDKESDCIVGHKRIDVARLDARRTYLGIDGLTYGAGGGRWKPVAAAASSKSARAAQAADRASLGTLASEIVTRVFSSPLYRYAAKKAPNGPLYQAVLKLNAAAAAGTRGGMAGYYDALVKQGIEFTIMAGGNSATTVQRVDFVRKEAVYSDGNRVVTVPIYAIDVNNGALALKVDDIMLLPGGLFYLVTGGGISAGQNQAVTLVDATASALDLVDLNGATAVGLAGRGASPLIGADGGTLIGMDGASLIGMDGASLIGMDGASLIGMDGASLIGMDGASLIGMDGASLIGADGGSLIGADGASLLPGY